MGWPSSHCIYTKVVIDSNLKGFFLIIMARLKVLHLLYSGCEKGGAQRVAVECAAYNADLYTSTVKSGGLSHLFKKKFIKFYKLIFNYKFDIIFCSDPRALLLSLICLRSFLSKRYLILHSDKLIKSKKLIIFLCRFFSVHCICTTKTQFDTFSKHLSNVDLVKIADIPEMKLAKQQSYGLLYFGRLDPIKNIHEIVDIFSRLRKKNSRFKLTIVGKGSECFEKTKGIEIIREWKSQEELKNIMKKSSFIINATNHEGFSLQIMEGISNGLFPLVKSNGLITNYNLSKKCFLSVQNIENATCLDNYEWQQVITKFQESLCTYLESTVHLKEYIRLEVKG